MLQESSRRAPYAPAKVNCMACLCSISFYAVSMPVGSISHLEQNPEPQTLVGVNRHFVPPGASPSTAPISMYFIMLRSQGFSASSRAQPLERLLVSGRPGGQAADSIQPRWIGKAIPQVRGNASPRVMPPDQSISGIAGLCCIMRSPLGDNAAEFQVHACTQHHSEKRDKSTPTRSLCSDRILCFRRAPYCLHFHTQGRLYIDKACYRRSPRATYVIRRGRNERAPRTNVEVRAFD